MIAGTLSRLEQPVDEPLEDYLHDSGFPALSVERTQQGLDGTPIQQGAAASVISTVHKEITAGETIEGDSVFVDVERTEGTTRIVTEWVADVTESGVILAESLAGSDPAFPLGLFWSRTESEPVRQGIAVDELHREWSSDDVLGDVWMTSREEEDDGANIAYHEAASPEETPTIGLGFRRPWDGTAIRGVVYDSGYVALYSTSTASKGVRFVAEELLPYAHPLDDRDTAQATLGEASDDGDDFADEVADMLDDEGYDYDRGGGA